MSIRKFLDLSTAHLTPATREFIKQHQAIGPIYDHPDGYGWVMFVPDEDDIPTDAPTTPADLLACYQRARRLKCDYIMFDADGPDDEELPIYEDEPETSLGETDQHDGPVDFVRQLQKDRGHGCMCDPSGGDGDTCPGPDGKPLCQSKEKIAAIERPEPQMKLAIVLEGGLVQFIVSDTPEAFSNVDIVVVDYDTNNDDPNDQKEVPQRDGSISTAYASDWSGVDRAEIDLDRVWEQVFAEKGE